MVSLRRRRLLGLSCGHNFFPIQLVEHNDGENGAKNSEQDADFSKSPCPDNMNAIYLPVEKKVDVSDVVNGSTKSIKKGQDLHAIGFDIKRRKRHRRRHMEDQETLAMRGVYYKNMKWQAAIKVDKKQIHLGTVGTREEAAHLYDRAAFMCGREPNFELPEEEKEELRQYSWVEFLTKTRIAITSKKLHRRISVSNKKMFETSKRSGDLELEGGDLSASENSVK